MLVSDIHTHKLTYKEVSRCQFAQSQPARGRGGLDANLHLPVFRPCSVLRASPCPAGGTHVHTPARLQASLWNSPWRMVAGMWDHDWPDPGCAGPPAFPGPVPIQAQTPGLLPSLANSRQYRSQLHRSVLMGGNEGFVSGFILLSVVTSVLI